MPGISTPDIPVLATRRLILDAFRPTDQAALAQILLAPEVARGITVHAATPARARAAAARRIAWHNASWASHGYGIWAIRVARGVDNAGIDTAGTLIGWCGFTPPDLGTEPELLYGLAPHFWGIGLAREAAEAALAWLFEQRPQGRPVTGATAVIFGEVNPASTALIQKLGFARKGRMAMADMLTDRGLADDVIAYEIWRLGKSRCAAPEALLFECPFKAGQIASLFPWKQHVIADALRTAASRRRDLPEIDQAERMMRVRIAFEEGLAKPHLDWWRKGR
jgi:RimJ/RimL family protein N-acetyltransferase